MRLPTRLIGLCLAASLAFSACSGEDGAGDGNANGEEPSETAASPTASETPYLAVPEGVELSEQGSELEVGERATVAYEPRQGTIGALDITVTSLEKASFALFEGWDLTKEVRKTAPYFVRATIENVGDTDLGGRDVPLYMLDGENRLIRFSVFKGSFKPCEAPTFPQKFRSGDRVKACMVYLAPGKGELTAASFRPTQEFDPITWTGDLTRAGAEGEGKKSSKGERPERGEQSRGDRG